MFDVTRSLKRGFFFDLSILNSVERIAVSIRRRQLQNVYICVHANDLAQLVIL